MIKLEGLNKYYVQGKSKFHALKDINLMIQSGEFVSIVGASGSGKTTLINILGFLDDQFDGQFLYKKKKIHLMSRDEFSILRNEDVGFIFQNFKLIDTLSIQENICLPLIYAGERLSSALIKAEIKLQSVGLNGLGKKKPSELSGGQQQRVAIARALMTSPSFIIADEPTGALDSHTSEEIISLFEELHEHTNTTIIMVTHDRNIANKSERIIEIFDGRIIYDTRV